MLTDTEYQAHEVLLSAQAACAIDFDAGHDLEIQSQPVDAADTLHSWLGAPPKGERFIEVAHDGTGGMFCVWERHRAVVFFGSEGDLAIVAASYADWVGLLADGAVWNWEEWHPHRESNPLSRFLVRCGVSPGGVEAPELLDSLTQWLGSIASIAEPEGPSEVLGRALSHWGRGNRQEAKTLLDQHYDSTIHAAAILGATLVNWRLEDGEIEAAVHAANTAIALIPNQPGMNEARGRALMAAGRHGEAASAFRQAGSSPPILRYLATALEHAGVDATEIRIQADDHDLEIKTKVERIKAIDESVARARTAQIWLDNLDHQLHPGAAAEAKAIIADAQARGTFSLDDYRKALAEADEDTLPAAHADLGLALWQAGHNQDAWNHLEAAVMSLSANSPLTKKAFAALDDLEPKLF